MNMRKTFLTIALAGSFAALAVHGADIYVDVAPPAPQMEDSAVREGYVFTPGYWQWNEPSRKHVWAKGEYVPARRGEHWVAHEWREDNGRYRFNEGHWEHDKGQ